MITAPCSLAVVYDIKKTTNFPPLHQVFCLRRGKIQEALELGTFT